MFKKIFKNKNKEKELELLDTAVKRHNSLSESIFQNLIELHDVRTDINNTLVPALDSAMRTLKSAPTDFLIRVCEYKVAVQGLNAEANAAQAKLIDISVKDTTGKVALLGTGAAVSAGVTTALAGPGAASTAVMAYVGAFGTASTGTAIATLSGAAATNATMAAIGGGAAAAGGGGMVAGAAKLTAIGAFIGGPLAWGIGGLALVGTSYVVYKKSIKTAEQAKEEQSKVWKGVEKLKSVNQQLLAIQEKTIAYSSAIDEYLRWFEDNANRGFSNETALAKEKMLKLQDSVHSLTETLNMKVSMSAD